MKLYLELLNELQKAVVKDNRTGISAASKFFHHMEFDLAESFPAVTTKQLYVKSVIGELLGFIRGADDNAVFKDLKCRVWEQNANEHGKDINGNEVRNPWLSNPFREGHDHLGRIYGVQWRNWDHTTYLTQEQHSKELDDSGVYLMHHAMLDMGYQHMGWLDETELHVYRKTCDQLKEAVHQLTNNPLNRRILISGWNPGDLDKMALPPCHVLQHWQCMPLTLEERIEHHRQDKFERSMKEMEEALERNKDKDDFWLRHVNLGEEAVRRVDEELHQVIQDFSDNESIMNGLDHLDVPKYKLNLMMYQRSCDTVLGLPFNVASYAVMVHIMARITGHAVGTFHYVTGDTHIYGNHDAAVEEQLARNPIENSIRLKIAQHLQTLEDFENATPDDFELVGYSHHGPLKNETPMAV